MQYDVIGVGIATYDMLCVVPSIPKIDETTVMLEYKEDIGGPVAIALVCLSRLGAKTKMIGKIGDDKYGEIIRDKLKAEGVDVSDMVVEKNSPSPFSFILIDSLTRKRTIIFNPGCCFNLKDNEINFSSLDNTKYLHLDGALLEVSKKIASYAKSKNIKTSLDIALAFPGINDLLKNIDIFIPPKEIGRDLSKEKDDFEKICIELLNYGCEVVCVTLGEDGCVVGDKEKVLKVPAYKVNVVDTTGAGDVFHGAFLYGKLQNWDIEKIAKFSNAVSAINCTKMGGREGIPDLKKVEEFYLTQDVRNNIIFK